MIIGVDKGSTYTKTSKGFIIKSTARKYSESELNLNNETDIVELFGKKYAVGSDGRFSADLMKAKHENTKILIYTAIARSFESDYLTVSVVVGLPIALYSRNKEEMKSIFEKNKIVSITINGKKKSVVIKNLEVFPEAAGSFYTQPEKDCMIIDIGGLSIDNALFKNGKLVKYSTYSMGLMKLYSAMANDINSRYDLSLKEWDMEDIIENGLYIWGQKVEIGDDLIISHVNEIVERLKLEYDLKAINNVLLTGGGGKKYFDYLKTHIPQLKLMDNSQYSNAYGFEKVGRALFDKQEG